MVERFTMLVYYFKPPDVKCFLFQFWNSNPDWVLSHSGKNRTPFLIPLSTQYGLCVWLPGLITANNKKYPKKWQSCPTASSPYRYREYESPYLTSLNNGNAMAGDAICSAMPLGFFFLLAPDWGKKLHQGCYWGNWQKWNMMAKYCINFFLKAQVD